MTIQTLLAEAREWRSFRLDPAWVAIAAIFAALAVIVPTQAATSATFTAKAIWSVLPFFALSIGLAAYAKASGAENLIARAYSGRSDVMIVLLRKIWMRELEALAEDRPLKEWGAVGHLDSAFGI